MPDSLLLVDLILFSPRTRLTLDKCSRLHHNVLMRKRSFIKPVTGSSVLLAFSMVFPPVSGQADEGNRVGFRLVEPAPAVPALAREPETAPAVPQRIRLNGELSAAAASLSTEERAALQLALEGDGVRGRAGNLILPGMQVVVNVLVQGKEEVRTNPQRINESGRIALPLILNVPVANMSLEEIENRLAELYSEYFRDPHVIVEFVGSTDDPYLSPWGFVTLMGNVGRPGPVAVPPTQNMTVSGAIKAAGGESSSANTTAITVFRPNLETNSVERYSINLRNVGRRGNHEDDIIVKAGDVIFIPERIF